MDEIVHTYRLHEKSLNEKSQDTKYPVLGPQKIPWKIILFVLFMAYALFFWTFMFQDGQFTILHKREPSLKNIVIETGSPKNILGGLATYYAIRTQYCGVVFSIGSNGIEALDFW